jgi:hypothetical protein|nr:MAG TPA: hypothetical protein [Caudoviricetes sp.]
MKRIIKEINNFESNDIWEIYNDFLMISAENFRRLLDKDFNIHHNIYDKYSNVEINSFNKMLIVLDELLQNDKKDHLGDLLMELEMANKLNGQFFSPFDISLISSMLGISKNEVDIKIKEKGYITLHEMSVGGGAIVIAVAKLLSEWGYNPKENLLVVCNDLDKKAIYMSYIQFTLLDIPSVIFEMDTLTQEIKGCWKTIGYYRKRKEFNIEFEGIEKF